MAPVYYNSNGVYIVSLPERLVETPDPTYPVHIRTRLTKAEIATLIAAVEAGDDTLAVSFEQGWTLTEKGKAAAEEYRREMERKGERFNGKA